MTVFYEHFELSKKLFGMKYTIIEAANKFSDNQASNPGNLTRLGWHITLMNGKDLSKQYRTVKLHSLF